MYDTVTVDTVPANPPAVAGYVAGHWPTYEGLVLRFPKAKHLSIAVQADQNAQCLDVEPGDASNAQAPAWVERQLARGVKRPVLYTSVSNWPALLATLHGAGISRQEIRIWSAHYGRGKHICSGACNNFGFIGPADATQWTDTSLGRNLDESVCQDSFFNIKSKPVTHYDWFAVSNFKIGTKTLNEQEIVKEYDRLRDRPLSRIIPNRPRLRVLRADLKLLANRVERVAIHNDPDKNGRPSWDKYHRGWRYQQLIHRSQGKRLIH